MTNNQTNNHIILSCLKSQDLERMPLNPIRSLTPTSLGRILDNFHAGNLKQAAMIWEAIEHRDDLLQGVISKRKKAVSRLPWEISTIDNSEQAMREKEILEVFYNNLNCVNAYDENITGGVSLLIKQMMDAVGKGYAVHEIVWKQIKNKCFLTAEMRFVPLWFFENKSGHLHFQPNSQTPPKPLRPDYWMITTGDGLMESCSIAYLFKHLPLRDWLIYCQRNGMPGVKGITNARPGSNEWEMAREAVQNFGAEFHALMTPGTDIQAIDISGKGELPYPKLVERMDRAMAALWRGSDLTTMGQQDSTGVSVQKDEKTLIEEDDARMISETLHNQLDCKVLRHLLGSTQPKAYFQLKYSANLSHELSLWKTLWEMGIELSINDIREHFGINPPANASDCLKKKDK